MVAQPVALLNELAEAALDEGLQPEAIGNATTAASVVRVLQRIMAVAQVGGAVYVCVCVRGVLVCVCVWWGRDLEVGGWGLAAYEVTRRRVSTLGTLPQHWGCSAARGLRCAAIVFKLCSRGQRACMSSQEPAFAACFATRAPQGPSIPQATHPALPAGPPTHADGHCALRPPAGQRLPGCRRVPGL